MQKMILRGALALLLAVPVLCHAHAILVEASPAKGDELAQAPEEIWLRFDAGVGKRYLALAVIDRQRKRRVDGKDARRDLLDPSIIRASLKGPLPPGKYIVRYRVQSADTHIITGRYTFSVVGELQSKSP